MKWLSEHQTVKSSRSLVAETVYKNAWDADDEDDEEEGSDDEENSRWVDFSHQEAKVPPRYVPNYGTHRFWHKGRLFILVRIRTPLIDGQSQSTLEREDLAITCFGRSAQPIKDLLQDAKDFYLLDHSEKTIIRRPAAKDMRRYGGRNCWTQIAHRPCRPMETVVLDAQRKHEVLADINEYLRNTTLRWYANRGIPYRRGYLFHGPPGTGKTSLAYSIAGVFGLAIYVISLLDPTLTEEELGQLFSSLPRRCVVLLEDIDTAGLTRKTGETESGEPASTEEKNSKEWKVQDLANAIKKASESTADEEKKKGISLSGLLNAIDGVASHEGRVLVMTTNKPETLDDALIRPGRVDLQVAFSNATKAQVRELFERMYSSDPTPTKRPVSTNGTIKLPSQPETPIADSSINTRLKYPGVRNKEVLQEIAESFSNKIPEDKFSPAEVQGFLLKRKKSPLKALSEIDAWVEDALVRKANKTKVLDLQ
jgi:chaperone BCS1